MVPRNLFNLLKAIPFSSRSAMNGDWRIASSSLRGTSAGNINGVRFGVGYGPYVDVRPRTSTYVDVRRRASTYVDVRRRTSTYVDVRRRTSTCGDVRRRAATYVDVGVEFRKVLR